MQRLLNSLCATSLLAALAVAILWVRSFWVCDTLMAFTGGRGIAFHSTGGQYIVIDDSDPSTYYVPGVSWQRESNVVPYGTHVPLALVRFEAGRFGNGRLFVVPQWPLVAAAALPPAAVVARRRRRLRRVAGGACAECGYDLRASSGACPECGTARDKGEGAWVQ